MLFSAALNMPANLETQQWQQDWKRSVFIPIPKKGNAKECSNYRTTALISHASKVMVKILQIRLQQYMNCELADVQAQFRKGRGTRDQIANICWIIEKESSRITSTSASLTTPKPLTVWIITSCGKFFKRWKYQTTLYASWDICRQVKKQQLELDMEQQTGSKLGKEYVMSVYRHPAYLTYMQSPSCEMPSWIKHKLESRFSGEIISLWDLISPLFGIGMKTDLFQSCGHCWVFQICWHIEWSTFTASFFRIWNSSAGIPSPPLALLVVMHVAFLIMLSF